MEKYNYNEKLIKELNMEYFIEKYELNNKEYNKAIFCAISSIYEHQNKIQQKYPTRSILLGDYYSFEYYSLLKRDLDKLKKLTDVMKEGYQKISNKEFTKFDFTLSIINTWLEFYTLKLDDSDKKMLIHDGENNARAI